jgi:hypothetical protein
MHPNHPGYAMASVLIVEYHNVLNNHICKSLYHGCRGEIGHGAKRCSRKYKFASERCTISFTRWSTWMGYCGYLWDQSLRIRFTRAIS